MVLAVPIYMHFPSDVTWDGAHSESTLTLCVPNKRPVVHNTFQPTSEANDNANLRCSSGRDTVRLTPTFFRKRDERVLGRVFAVVPGIHHVARRGQTFRVVRRNKNVSRCRLSTATSAFFVLSIRLSLICTDSMHLYVCIYVYYGWIYLLLLLFMFCTGLQLLPVCWQRLWLTIMHLNILFFCFLFALAIRWFSVFPLRQRGPGCSTSSTSHFEWCSFEVLRMRHLLRENFRIIKKNTNYLPCSMVLRALPS